MDDELDAEETRGSRFRPVKCKDYSAVEGWIVFVAGVHPEAPEDEIIDKFSEFGRVKNLHLNLDKRTCFNKGYALVEFEEEDDARRAVEGMNGTCFMEKVISVDFAFKSRN
jgi:RNA-binding protein 8A